MVGFVKVCEDILSTKLEFSNLYGNIPMLNI